MDVARLRIPLIVASALGLLFLTILALAVAPLAAGFSAPLTQRIFYFHVPSAAAAYVAFGVALLACIAFLSERTLRFDRVAAASAEVGIVLTTISLFTGIVWSRVEFFSASAVGGGDFAFLLLGDAKFVTTAALWLTFLGYLALRRSIDDEERRARLASVFGVLGFIGVPLSYISSRFSPHPDFLAKGSGLNPSLGLYLGIGMVVFFVLYAALFLERLHLADRLHGVEEARAQRLAAQRRLAP